MMFPLCDSSVTFLLFLPRNIAVARRGTWAHRPVSTTLRFSRHHARRVVVFINHIICWLRGSSTNARGHSVQAYGTLQGVATAINLEEHYIYSICNGDRAVSLQTVCMHDTCWVLRIFISASTWLAPYVLLNVRSSERPSISSSYRPLVARLSVCLCVCPSLSPSFLPSVRPFFHLFLFDEELL